MKVHKSDRRHVDDVECNKETSRCSHGALAAHERVAHERDNFKGKVNIRLKRNLQQGQSEASELDNYTISPPVYSSFFTSRCTHCPVCRLLDYDSKDSTGFFHGWHLRGQRMYYCKNSEIMPYTQPPRRTG